MTRLPTLFAATGIACLVGMWLPPTVSGSAPTAGQPTTAKALTASTRTALPKRALRFSHEVVVDEQRSGFEPDVLVDSKDRMYTSVPNGSSEGTSFVWVSRDHGKTFALVPGSVLQGKPATCSGGGDTELQLDKQDNLFLSDLQNLTNLSNSVTTDQGSTWKTTCVGAANTPVDRMWYAVHGTLGKPGFLIYEEYDAVDSAVGGPGGPAGNQLVEEVSNDGVNFVPVVNPTFSSKCLGGGALNCVSNDEGISGNQLITPMGEVVIAHTSADGNGVVVSHATPKITQSGGLITSATAHWSNVKVNGTLCPDKAGQAPGICGATQFATVARDSHGTLYVSFSSCKIDKNGDQVGPYSVYVAHSTNGGKTWSRATRVSRGGSNSFSWITAGSKGRTAMAWYHANQMKGKDGYTFDDLATAEFGVQVGESTHSTARRPGYVVKTVSEHPIKYGPICTQGLGCTISGGDRSLGDFLEVGHDRRGALALSYVDDTSNTYTTGLTGGIAENGPPVIVRQVHGTALIKGAGNKRGLIRSAGRGPSRAMTRVIDRTRDAFYSANGKRTPAVAALDLRGARISMNKAHTALVAHMRVRSAKSLSVPAADGGTTGEWILRFTTYNPHTLGNGHIYYAGMQSIAGAKPTFYDGDVAAPAAKKVQLSMSFSSAGTTKGTYDAKRGTITIQIPLRDVPGVRKHARLFSATAFTGTTTGTLSAPHPTGLEGQINQIDATAPFDYVVARDAKVTSLAAASSSTTGQLVLRSLLGALGGLLLGGAVWLTARRRQHRPVAPVAG